MLSKSSVNKKSETNVQNGKVKSDIEHRLDMEIKNIQNQIKKKTPFVLLDKNQYLLCLEYIRDGLT